MRIRVTRDIVALIATLCICVLGLGTFTAISSWADVSSKNPESASYQLEDGTQYNRTGRASTASFAYGRKAIGSLRIESSFSQESSYKSRKAYGVFDEIRIRYGKNWVNVENGRYANGLYTTDYGTYYASGDNVFIYSPEGKAVIQGVYIRVYYAYQACAYLY